MSQNEETRQQQEATVARSLSQEEDSSLRNAMIVMVVVSIGVLILYLSGVQPFLFEFDVGVFFTPAIILFVGWLVTRRRKSGVVQRESTLPTQGLVSRILIKYASAPS